MKGVSRYSQPNRSYPVDHGYVIIPTKKDRDQYVASCYRREKISIIQENGGGVLKDCSITRDALKDIEFPIDSDTLGQLVVYVCNPFDNHPIIIGVVSKENESMLLDEGSFKLEKTLGQNKVGISGNAKTGALFIDVQDDNDDGKGTLIINVAGSGEGSSIKISCKGRTTIYSDDTVNLETTGEVNIKSINESDETKFSSIKVKNDNVNITPVDGGTFTISGGSEPLLLGNKTVEQLEKEVQALTSLLDSIAQIIPVNVPVNSPDPTWATWQAQVALITQRGDFSEVKSEISFTD